MVSFPIRNRFSNHVIPAFGGMTWFEKELLIPNDTNATRE